MNELMRRVEDIAKACEDPKKKKKEEEEVKKMDDFMRLKKKIANDVREVRKQIEERNELFKQTSESNPQGVRISSDIRGRLRDIQKDVEQLGGIQAKEAEKVEKLKKKGKVVPDDLNKEIQLRAEIVDLCKKHVDECKNLEKSGYGNSAPSAAYLASLNTKADNVPASLPDIDDPRFQQLIKTDKLIDEKLDIIAEGVGALKEIAVEMGKEIELQGVMMEELETHVDKTTANLVNLNKRLKDQLNKVRSCDRFILDIICCIIILGLIGYIYNIIAKAV